MTLDAILAGIEILRKYTDSKYPVDAQHDTLYFKVDDSPTAEDRARLAELGWRIDGDLDDPDIWSCWP